jgi:hypothetical protein
MNSPAVDSVPSAGKVLVDAALVRETPMGGTDAVVGPTGETIAHETPIGTNAGSSAALLNREESGHFRTRWNEIQGKFADALGHHAPLFAAHGLPCRGTPRAVRP